MRELGVREHKGNLSSVRKPNLRVDAPTRYADDDDRVRQSTERQEVPPLARQLTSRDSCARHAQRSSQTCYHHPRPVTTLARRREALRPTSRSVAVMLCDLMLQGPRPRRPGFRPLPQIPSPSDSATTADRRRAAMRP